jgi:putative transposase
LSQIIKIDEAKVSSHLGDLVRKTVQQTLNDCLDAEAQGLCNARRYERTEARKDCRAGFYHRKLQAQAGEVQLNIPKRRYAKFETAIIERYRRRECSVEEALMEMYLAGVSVRRVEDITEALWGTRVSAGAISDLNQKLYERIDAWRNEPLRGEYPYVYLDGICLKRTWAGEVRNVSVLVAVGIGMEGFRDTLVVVEGPQEDVESWRQFLTHLKGRGLSGVQLIVSDKCMGLAETLTYYRFPREHRRQIRSNNMLERVMREIRRRTRVVGSFPDGRSALMLAAGRLRYVSGGRWGTRRYMDMNRLKELQDQESATADNAAA